MHDLSLLFVISYINIFLLVHRTFNARGRVNKGVKRDELWRVPCLDFM